MKRINIGYMLLIMLCFACTPDDYDVYEMGATDMANIGQIKLCLSHYQLLADGKAELELTPILTTKDSFEVADERVDYSAIEFCTLSGETLPQTFSTSDLSRVGEEVKVYAQVPGYGLISDTVSFTITDPSAMEDYEEITIPIVFHLIQSEGDIASYGGEIPQERINRLLEKMNNAFSGAVSHNATGIDTKIRFQAALYDPNGDKLNEPGIHRVYVSEVTDVNGDQYASFIAQQNAFWDYTKYLNVWLISDASGEYRTFYKTISTQCIPRYVSEANDLQTAPQGLELSEMPADWVAVPNEVGIVYKLQSTFLMVRAFGENEENELTNCLGYYLGLLPTWSANANSIPDDFCSDTHSYYGNTSQGINTSNEKRVGDYLFLSENIMDDPSGVHRSVTLQQAQRMHWVLQHCPERSCWKSDYAFTGE